MSPQDTAIGGRHSAVVTARGRMTLLSAAERRYCEPLLQGFAKAHPDIEVDFVFGISTDLHRRYLAEAAGAGPTADLFWSSAMDQMMGLVLDGHAQPHGVQYTLPAEAAYRNLAISTTCEPLYTLTRDPSVPAGTPSEIAARFRSDPARFHGRVALPDIEANGLGFLAMLRWRLTEPGFDEFLEALRSVTPRLVGSAPALVSAVTEGGALALHLLGAYARRAVAADAALHLAPSASPALAVSRVAFIPRRAANPEAASAFLAYMLSRDGQAALGEAGLFPILGSDSAALAPIPLDESFPRLLDAASRADLVARWRSAVGRSN